MVELSLVTSASFGNFHQEQQQRGLYRGPVKDFQTLFPGHITRQDVLGPGHLQLKSSQLVDLQRSSSLPFVYEYVARPASSVLVDVQDISLDSVLFSCCIMEQCIQREKVLEFLKSASNLSNGEGPDASLLSDLMGLHTLTTHTHSQLHNPINNKFCLQDIRNDLEPSYRYSQGEISSLKSFVGLADDPSFDSMVMMHQDDRVLFMNSEVGVKDLLSVVAQAHLLKNTIRGSQKHQMVVPYFRRSKLKAQGAVKFHTVTTDPPKSLKNTKLRSLPKKRQIGRERDIHMINYSQVCENLLSLILINRKDKHAVVSLKKYGHELPHLLTQLSAGIAGTGLAVMFSVIWKLTSGPMSLSTSKLWNTVFAFGLVWLAFAVNSLRDVIIDVAKNVGKLRLRDEELACKVECSVKEIFFRFAAVMAVAVLRFV